jgi:glycine oxidase
LQRSNGFTIAGTSSDQVDFNRSIDAKVVSDITTRACELLPALAGERPVAVWAGFRPAADSAGPVIQRAGDSRLWLAYGHYRNGILLAPVTAGRISREIAGGHATQQA